LIVKAQSGKVRILCKSDLEDYVLGVLGSEIPASYHVEAIKAQAIAARTYALRPRIDHSSDQCQVCDSFLCCQAFLGDRKEVSLKCIEAVATTDHRVITYNDEPILALFSSCAGGHTESYETCFSDPKTNAFPPPPIPYLKGISEGSLASGRSSPISEKALAAMWHARKVTTVDAWSPQFRWSIALSSDLLVANMHYVVETMLNDKDMAPFIVPPPSGLFGQINAFHVEKRGLGGTAISLAVNTSKGTWVFKKELVIRTVFKNPEVNLNRLKSARIYFEHNRNTHGGLSAITVYGLGFGHGVGLQQTGAQGWARFQKKICESILEHYFTGIELART